VRRSACLSRREPVLNISCYKFVPLPDAAALRDLLHERAVAAALKGTILLADEGINLFLAGPAAAVRGFVDALRTDPRFADLEPKESWSGTVPFRKMLVKVKREIIRMDHPTIRPRRPGTVGDPATLHRWLAQGHDDAGREVVTLDTRNAFEVDEGTFDNAIDWRIDKFTEFPPALRAHKAELAGQDRGELLHRGHPLRKGGHPDARGRPCACLPARRRHPEILSKKRMARTTTAAVLCLTSAARWPPTSLWAPSAPRLKTL
jgi:hypothetical protein